MSDIRPNILKKMKITAAIVAAFAIGFMVARFAAPSPNKASTNAASARIQKLFETRDLLKRCQPGRRELAFLEEGGEYFMDSENPRTLNDKISYVLQKYFYKSPITAIIGNKYLAKKYVAETAGEEYVVKLLGAWEEPSEIEWNKLPNRFVLKTVRGHFGRQVIIVKDKNKLDFAATVKKLEESCQIIGMKYITGKRIIAEEYLESPDGRIAPIDYKFFCSFGKVFFAYCLAADGDDYESDDKTFSFYFTQEWKRMPVIIDGQKPNFLPPPKNLARMIALAKKLSKPFPLIRIDLYEIGDRVLVGELTEDSGGAKYIFSPVTWDFKLGEMIGDLPKPEELEKLIENDMEKYGKADD
ncbi:MAG: hypothetical protein LBL99_01195 [Holosporaceae bacterium]|jgi:glutathione synthase/RimK-type ligase-like ATP-grasp enzyme|nr:hypothetical protein [Holosporaceae bacterium]